MTIDNGPRKPLGDARHYRRGIFLLPSIITVGNMFCGYACVVFAMRNELATAAPFIGIAVILDMLDGRIARLTNTTSAFGLEFDSLADVISFGLAPAILAFAWGLSELGRVGWAAGFVFVTAAAMRLARFNIQSHVLTDKRYFIGMPSPAAAGITAATVYAWPYPLVGPPAVAAVAVVIVPAILMVSTIRFRSFKTINFGWTPSYINIILVAGLIALIATAPQITLLVISYGYLLSAFIEMALTRNRPSDEAPALPEA
ncbi:MAG: CDP-diacylglycerol--serine O-phosphatidyltransferase [Acidobacteria bacterium]|nr:CDP-diacylglycerol--serine O-phosphatidyltransferase [Acidobacteriota bacterium]